MNNKKNSGAFHLTIRFISLVFFTSSVAGMLSAMIAVVMYKLEMISFNRPNPHPILLIISFLLASIIIGTLMAAVVGKKSVSNLGRIINVVSEIGKGNFDVKLEENFGNVDAMNEIAQNINIMAGQLKNVEILRNDFIQNFSHEFKTPIVSIQGFAKRLLTKNLSEETKREYLNIILEESERLAALSTNTLYMSKLESMDQSFQSTAFSLDEQIRQCVLLLEKEWSKKKLDLSVDLPPLTYFGNEELLKQVWLNLLGNAVKFTGENGKIIISSQKEDNGLIISLTDNGIGMDEATVSRIFDKYYQADPSRATEGNGLGLAIVKKIIGIIGGEIFVKSTAGGGSTFTVVLPRG